MPRRKRTISDLQARLAAQIIDFARENELEKGHHLVEDRMAQLLGVSRSPVRRTLNYLVKAGVVTAESNRGFFLACAARDIDPEAIRIPVGEEDRLYANIINDRTKGGFREAQTEVQLMRRYRVKRGLLTRVLWRLAKEGIVERGPGVGWTFSPTIDSPKTHEESYRLRMLIEPAGLLEPTFQLDAKRLAQVREDHERMLLKGAHPAIGANMFDMNAQFHEMLAAFSGNSFFLQIIQQHNRLRRLMEYRVHDPERIAESCREHLAVIEALETGDLEWAASLLRRHLNRARQVATEAGEKG